MTPLRSVLAAVSSALFAAALGIALGAGPLQDDLHDAFLRQPEQAGPDPEQRARTVALRRTAQYTDEAVTSLAPALLAGRLDDRPVAVLALPGAVDAQVQAVAEDIQSAGGSVTTRMRMAKDLVDPAARTLVDTLTAGQVREYDALDVPGDASVYERVGLVLGRALLTDSDAGEPLDDAASGVVNGFVTAGLLNGKVPDQRASLAVIVAGPVSGVEEVDTARASIIATVARTMDSRGDGVVVAGPAEAASPGGAVASVRDDQEAEQSVSTIDTLHTRLGQVATVLALAEQAAGNVGHYGAVDAPDGAVPR